MAEEVWERSRQPPPQIPRENCRSITNKFLMHQATRLAATVGALWLAIGEAPRGLAAAVTVTNYSFQVPGFTTDGDNNGSVPGWTFEGVAGQSHFGITNPSGTNYSGTDGADAPLPGTADGSQAAYLDKTSAANAYLHSDPVLTIAADTRYTLTIAVGYRKGYSYALGGAVGFESGGITIPSLGGRFFSTDLAVDTFVDFTATFTTAASGDPLVGQPLGIRFTISNNGGTQFQGHLDFDNVRLDATPVPEQSALTLGVATGLILMCVGRKRNAAGRMTCDAGFRLETE
ncbi:MAG: hypothetical protein ABMA13_16245 [Chthoniobacteraceae bacterium]